MEKEYYIKKWWWEGGGMMQRVDTFETKQLGTGELEPKVEVKAVARSAGHIF